MAFVALTVGSMAHTAAGGLLPGPAVWVILFGALAVIATAALTSPAGYVRLFALIGGGQAAVHLVLSLAAGHVGSTPAAAPRVVVETGSVRFGGVREQLAVVPEPRSSAGPAGSDSRLVEHLVEHLAGADAWMLLTHLVASAAVAWWLWRGEQAAWSLIALLWGWVVPLLSGSRRSPRGSAGRVAWRLADWVGHRPETTGSISRRGPPPCWVLPN